MIQESEIGSYRKNIIMFYKYSMIFNSIFLGSLVANEVYDVQVKREVIHNGHILESEVKETKRSMREIEKRVTTIEVKLEKLLNKKG